MLSFEKKLAKRKACGNLRKLQMTHAPIDFSSNDYLGLARSSPLASTVIQEWGIHLGHLNGLGSTGSRLLTGNSYYAQELEERIAHFHGYEAGLLFSCGYMANMGLLSTIAHQADTLLFDACVHASTRDGIRLSRAKAFPFRHNDLEQLESRLKNCSLEGDRFICIESIYSTDGSQAPLKEMCDLAKRYDAKLIVDEAHAVGIYGPSGRGLISAYNLNDHVFAQICTFGKALGVYGAIVLGSHTLKQALINFAPSYIYTTALPLLSLASIKCSYELFPRLDKERQQLHHLIQMFREAFPSTSLTHIQSIPVKGNEVAKELSQTMIAQGVDVRPLLSPTVQRGSEVLRICLHAFNTKSELAYLFNLLRNFYDP